MEGSPNGLAFDPLRRNLLAANVSKPDDPHPITLSFVNVDSVDSKSMIHDITVPGRTRWAVYDKIADRFYVNISKPAQIAVVKASEPETIEFSYDIPGIGPHGLDIDQEGRRLFCACDQGGLFTINLESGLVSKASSLLGPPDVIFHNPILNHLYVTIGDPGVIEVFETQTMKLVQTVKTEPGTHTIGFSQEKNKVYAFMPETHRASVYEDNDS